MSTVFLTGSTGYIGTRLIKKLLVRGHRVIALVRKGSEHKLPKGAEPVVADPFSPDSFAERIPEGAVFVQLLGVAHPSPAKAEQFKTIDLRSVKASADAAAARKIAHFVYVSVGMQETRLMKAYQEVRREGEKYCFSKGFCCTILRPWYVIGPGHWWPLILLPVYGLAELAPRWRRKIRPFALVTIGQMLQALVNAIESEPEAQRIMDIRQIRNKGGRLERKIPANAAAESGRV